MVFERNKYKDLFCTEAEEQIEVLSSTLLELEKYPDRVEHYETLMRTAHTIKGSSATMGYVQMAALAHAMEDVFHGAERGVFVIDSGRITVLLAAADRLSASLGAIKERDEELAVDDILAAIKEILNGAGSPQPALPPTHETHSPTVAPIAIPDTVKVNTEKLDTLMGLFEEMLMLRLKLDMLLEPAVEITKTIVDPLLQQKLFFVNEFKSTFTEFAHMLSLNQDILLAIRLVPLEQIFAQYPRMVRDLALREGKKIEFITQGGDIALDRTVIDGLGGALAHLLRNAIDHGIVQEGTIQLTAVRERGRAKVIVQDNGGGINYERVRAVALERGIDTKEHLDAIRNERVAELLFHPNMTTNETVTDISGRGIGLSAVRVFAQDVGGRIEVVSPVPETGVGTRFVLDLPISLATIHVLVIEARGYTFALPFDNIIKTLRFTTGDVTGALHQETLFIDGAFLPLIKLEEVLQLAFGGYQPGHISGDGRTAVIIRTGSTVFALEVDACTGEQDLLIKSLPALLRGNKGFSGSALLPDGRTILLLDAHGLLLHVVNDILRHTPSPSL